MNIVSFHKRDLQLVIQYLSIARITGLSEEFRFFSANPINLFMFSYVLEGKAIILAFLWPAENLVASKEC